MRGSTATAALWRVVVPLIVGLWCALAPVPAAAQDAALEELLARADRAFEKGDYDRAAALLDRAIAERPGDLTAAAFAKRASIFFIKDQHAAGLRWIADTADERFPDDPQIAGQKALLLSRMPGRSMDAVILAEQVLAKRPDDLALLLLVGDFYLREGSAPGKATRAYRSFLDRRPEAMRRLDKRVQAKLGFALLLAGEPANARRALATAIRTKGDARLDVLARRGLCAATVGLADYQAAVRHCERADREAGKRPDVPTVRHLAAAYLGLGRANSALETATRLTKLAPRKASTYLLLGDILVSIDELDRAERQYRRALLLDRSDPDVYRKLGRLAMKRTPPNPEEAIGWLERAARERPNDPAVYADLAEARLQGGNNSGAAADAARGLAMKPPPPQAARLHRIRGQALAASGDHAAAALELEASLAAAPSADARAALVASLNELAVAAVSAGKLGDAAARLDRALALAPKDPRSARNRAAVAIARDAPLVALKAAEADSDDPVLLRLRGRALTMTADTATARATYDRALPLASGDLAGEIAADAGALALADGDLGRAIELLSAATSAPAPFAAAARRDLALARCRRGVDRLATGDPKQALADLDQTDGLDGDLAASCQFARALARLAAGDAKGAAALLDGLTAGSWLKAPYDRGGLALVKAYADYRRGAQSKAIRALGPLVRGKGPLADQARALQSAAYEAVAYQQASAGKHGAARTSLARAARHAPAARKAIIEHNRIALQLTRGNPARHRAALAKMGSTPPEALANLGLIADLAGDPAKALSLWRKAKAAGVRSGDLATWIQYKEAVLE